MAPVVSPGVDRAVSESGQLFGTIVTYAIALSALLLVVRLCRRERILWPLIVTIAGGIACLLEPLFDHLYGLWFFEEGQWNLFSSFGVNLPVWLPGAYLAIYGAGAVLVARQLQRAPTMRTLWSMYGLAVLTGIVGEIAYIKVFGVYEYQGEQPFRVLGYPLFMAFNNAMGAVVGGILIYAVVPRLRGVRQQLVLATVVPLAYAADLFGSGIIYLTIRHSTEDPSTVLLYVGALTVSLGIAATVRLLGQLLLPAPETTGTAAGEPAGAGT